MSEVPPDRPQDSEGSSPEDFPSGAPGPDAEEPTPGPDPDAPIPEPEEPLAGPGPEESASGAAGPGPQESPSEAPRGPGPEPFPPGPWQGSGVPGDEEFSPYPRSSPEGAGPAYGGRPPGVYFDAIGDAIQVVKLDIGLWLLAAFLALAISYATSFALSSIANAIAYGGPFPSDAERASRLLLGFLITIPFTLVSNAVGATLGAGLIVMGMNKLNGHPLDIGELFRGFSQFGAMLIGNSLMLVVVAIGAVLCLVPGLYVAGALAFVPLLIVRRRMGGVEAINASWEALRPYAFPMIGLMIVLVLLMLLGVLACGIGLLFAYPVYAVTMAIHYRAFFPEAVASPTQRIGPEPPRPQW